MSYIKLESPVLRLDFDNAFSQLSEKEKLYTYYLSKACWEGIIISSFQVSYESPAIFYILQSFFSSFSSIEEIQKLVLSKTSVHLNDYREFLAFAAGFYSNMGNYSSFGHTKFIPKISQEIFNEILKVSSSFNDIQFVWDCVKDIIYDYSEQTNNINLPERGGRNNYYLGNINESEIKKVDEILNQKKISPLNTRLIKINSNLTAYLVASAQVKTENLTENIVGYYGEFSEFLKRIVENLKLARNYASNELQDQMLQDYIESFETGSIEKHKDSQRKWVQDQSPVVETNLGWIETYIDPMGVRAYYEGWVALTDKKKSEKFQTLVSNAEKIIKTLPWPREFNMDVFIRPDFTAIDVVCFASTGCPLGINIPNYEDVRTDSGSKNVSLSNALPKFKSGDLKFATEQDKIFIEKYGLNSYTLHVGCHELLGHGTGKLFMKNENGELNFDEKTVNPVTGEVVDSFYNHNETYESRFGDICRSFEEFRADLCGIYLCFNKEIHGIFEIPDDLYTEIIYTNWLMYLRKGITGLDLFNPSNEKWGQAHTQGAFVFANYILQNQTEKIFTVEVDKDNNNFTIVLNKNNLMAHGNEMAGKLLESVQIWKSTGNSEKAREFYLKYSNVNSFFLNIRGIVERNKPPRRLELNNNLAYDNKNVTIKTYPETFEGIIESFRDRFGTRINQDIYKQWTKYDTSFF